MSKRVLTLAITLFAVLLVGQHFALKEQPDLSQIDQFVEASQMAQRWPGRVAPDFTLDTLDGKKFKLSDEVGKKVILINFFATWCEPCRQEMPELQRFTESLKSEPWIVVWVDAGEETAKVQRFVEEFKVTGAVGIDRARGVQKLYGVTAFPTNVLIGVDGRVLLHESGSIRNADVTLRPPVTTQLAELKAGKGISAEDYAKAAAGESYRDVLPRPERGGPKLEGRALAISEKMDCLCGCAMKVEPCGCNNAKKVKTALRNRTFGEETDADVMRELGKQFCMEAM